MPENINGQIDQILDRRIGRGAFTGHGHLDAVTAKEVELKKILSILSEYQVMRDNILYNIHEQKGEYYAMSLEDPLFAQAVEAANAEESINSIYSALGELELLKKRFSRETINISVVGRARQGKSCLLQSISGLRDEVIPASNGGDCTGAKSVICNSLGQLPARATVVFYNEVELVNIIQRYLDELHIHVHLGAASNIPSLSTCIADFIAKISQKNGREQSLFNHFKKYVEHYNEYREYLGREVNVDEDHIRDFVAQYDVNMMPTYKFLAVKEVRIYTEFNYADAGKIVLVDTIGLGDTSLGIGDKMLETLKNDSDAAILVRLPSANGDSIRVEDDQLYDSIAESMGMDMLNKWLFFALNVGDVLQNYNSGDAMENAFRQRQLNFASITKVDCSKSDEVQDKLLIPILEYLIDNLAQVDNNLMEKANKALDKAYLNYFGLCGKASSVLRGGLKKALSTGGLFDDLFRDKLGLMRQLNKLNLEYNTPDAENDQIRMEVLRIVRSMGRHCPTLSEIKERLTEGGPNSHVETAYNYYADNLRAMMRDSLDEINSTVIVRLQDEVKDRIIEVLRSDDGGRLGRIPVMSEGESVTPLEWFKELIAQKTEEFPLVKTAFKDIVDFRLNIEGLLEYKANLALRYLDQESPSFTRLPMSVHSSSVDEKAEIILQTLMSTIPDIAQDLMDGIKELLRIPANSFNARIRKLRERLIFKEDGLRELKNFYREYAPAIWADDFKNIVGKQVALDEWNVQLDKLNGENKKSNFMLQLQ